MKQPAFALFERSLRVETRSVLVCLARVGLLMIVLLLLLIIQRAARSGVFGAPGLEFLKFMVWWVNFAFITLAGFSYFASAITEEKEEMMLGLLRMTDLNPIAILLGKSVSRLVGAFLMLVVQLPFVLLAVTLGGVGLIQILAAYSSLLAYLFLLCNAALLCSVVFRNTATAGGTMLLLVFLFLLGPFMAAGIMDDLASWYNVNPQHGMWHILAESIAVWRRASPLSQLTDVFQTGFKGPVIGFQVLSNLALGLIAFLLSWLVFDWCTRTEKDAAPTRRWSFTRKSRNSRLPRHVAGASAIAWKDFAFITGGKSGLLLKFVVWGLIVCFYNLLEFEKTGKVTWEYESGLFISVSIFLTVVWMALEASRVFKDEVRWKTLSSLMTLPMSVSEIAYRKALGALAGTLPLLAGVVLGFLIYPNKLGDTLAEWSRTELEFWGWVVFILAFILFLHLTAFLSLVIKRGALPLAIAIYGVGFAFFIMFAMILFAGFSGGPGGVYFVGGFICVVLTIPLHLGIKYRLELLAAQE